MDLNTAEQEVRKAIARSSQERVGKAIGVNPSILSRWLNGHSEPEGTSRERIFAWAERQVIATNPQSPAVTDSAWQLTVQTMRVQAELVSTLAAEVQKQQAPIVAFLLMLEQGRALEASRSSEAQQAIAAVQHARDAEARGAAERNQRSEQRRGRKQA